MPSTRIAAEVLAAMPPGWADYFAPGRPKAFFRFSFIGQGH